MGTKYEIDNASSHRLYTGICTIVHVPRSNHYTEQKKYVLLFTCIFYWFSLCYLQFINYSFLIEKQPIAPLKA